MASRVYDARTRFRRDLGSSTLGTLATRNIRICRYGGRFKTARYCQVDGRLLGNSPQLGLAGLASKNSTDFSQPGLEAVFLISVSLAWCALALGPGGNERIRPACWSWLGRPNLISVYRWTNHRQLGISSNVKHEDR
nr:hypothetical protein CFP56_78096 [Quercus suber]